MRNNLVETVRFCFSGEVIHQLGVAVDETGVSVAKTLGKAIPLVLNSLLVQADHEGEPATLLHLAREADAVGALGQLADIHDNAWHEQGSNLLLDLLGDAYRTTVNHLATTAGIRPAAAGTLLQVSATAVLGVLGRFAVDNELTPNELVGWLQAQKNEIATAMLPDPAEVAPAPTPPTAIEAPRPTAPPRPVPTPPRMVSAPRRAAPMGVPRAAAARATQPAAAASSNKIGPVWQWGALLLVVAGMSYYLGRDQSALAPTGGATSAASLAAPSGRAVSSIETHVATSAAAAAVASHYEPEVTGRYDQDRDTYIYDLGAPISLELPDGTALRVGAASTENQLYTLLATPSVGVDSASYTKGWLTFDRVNFEPASATLTRGSTPQLRNIAAILKNFPEVVVRIGSYTDSTGARAQNFRLSQERAQAARTALIKLGVEADHLQAKGYGANYFVASNKTATGRALNRRVCVRVIEK